MVYHIFLLVYLLHNILAFDCLLFNNDNLNNRRWKKYIRVNKREKERKERDVWMKIRANLPWYNHLWKGENMKTYYVTCHKTGWHNFNFNFITFDHYVTKCYVLKNKEIKKWENVKL